VIVFDMDETLIHCVDDIEEECPHHVIEIKFDDEPEPIEAGINIRPYAEEVLREAKKLFYVVVWTASMQAYADAVLNLLDPHNELIDMRLYRPSCH
jgi:CTD small phosphatase-like protein 2